MCSMSREVWLVLKHKVLSFRRSLEAQCLEKKPHTNQLAIEILCVPVDV